MIVQEAQATFKNVINSTVEAKGVIQIINKSTREAGIAKVNNSSINVIGSPVTALPFKEQIKTIAFSSNVNSKRPR